MTTSLYSVFVVFYCISLGFGCSLEFRLLLSFADLLDLLMLWWILYWWLIFVCLCNLCLLFCVFVDLLCCCVYFFVF